MEGKVCWLLIYYFPLEIKDHCEGIVGRKQTNKKQTQDFDSGCQISSSHLTSKIILAYLVNNHKQ